MLMLQVVRDAVRATAELAELHRCQRRNGKLGLTMLGGPGATPFTPSPLSRPFFVLSLPQSMHKQLPTTLQSLLLITSPSKDTTLVSQHAALLLNLCC
jgi:hypothetical protein